MVDVACGVPARRSVDRPAAVDFEQVACVPAPLDLLACDPRPDILDDEVILFDDIRREKSKACFRPSDAKGAFRPSATHSLKQLRAIQEALWVWGGIIDQQDGSRDDVLQI